MSKVLKCRLIRAVVTDKLHFIPTGTPVEILRWADNSKNPHVPDDELKVRVRVDAYMYLGVKDEDENHPNVDSGLIVDIQTSNLDFMSYEQLPTGSQGMTLRDWFGQALAGRPVQALPGSFGQMIFK